MTFTLLNVITYCMLSFAVALYVGAFVQRRRDVKAFKMEREICKYKEKLNNEISRYQEEQKNETKVC